MYNKFHPLEEKKLSYRRVKMKKKRKGKGKKREREAEGTNKSNTAKTRQSNTT
jgi:hypothetical protein